MGSTVAGKRLRELCTLLLIAAAMVLWSGSALGAQATYGVPQEPAAPPGQEDPAPVSQGAVPGTCDHAAGEFLVGYASEEALRAAPPENVVETFDSILAQHLAFEEIKNIPDPAERFAAEEAKRQELEARPSVAYAEYNCVATIQAASPEGAADLPAPASCGNCGRYVVDRAKEIIAGGFGDAQGKEAFDAALRAARSAGTDSDNVALASEVELDDEASAAGSSADDDYGAEGSASNDAEAGGSGSGESETKAGSNEKAADGEESGTEEKADNKESSSEDTEDEIEGEDSTGAGLIPIAGKNAAATSEPREVVDTGGRVMALAAGALLLAAGVYVAQRTFWR